ncbi:MAG TPA: Asp23/Gls24 family envelope stress response protein [Micromonosporaceae bacterium]
MTDIPAQASPSTAADADASTPDFEAPDFEAPAESRPGTVYGTATAATSNGAADQDDAPASTFDHASETLHEMAGRAGDAISHAADDAADRIAGATQSAVTRIRNNATLAAERGTTTIANEVVEKIAGIAIRDVPGVYDLGGDTIRLVSAVREKLHLGDESKAQGVSVKLDGNKADLSVTIVLEYGFVVSSVTDKVREKAISAVETLLGLDVTNVDILVDDIHVDEDGPVGNDKVRAAGYSSETAGITVGG